MVESAVSEDERAETAREREQAAELRRLIDAGQCFLAYDRARQALERLPDSRTLRLLAAFAALRSGAEGVARPLLDGLEEGVDTAEAPSLRLMAELYFQVWLATRRAADLRRSRDLHDLCAERFGEARSGADAALASWLLGEPDGARRRAGSVLEQALADAADRAEAALLRGDSANARRLYAEFGLAAGYGEVVGRRRRLDLLRGHGLDVPETLFLELQPPTVVVFAGQPLDRPGAADPTLPAHLEPALGQAIAEALDRLGADIGYCCAASGSDLLFAEAMLARGGEVHLNLPFAAEDFVAARVAYAGEQWVRRFEAVCAQAASVGFATEERYLGHDVLFRYNNQVVNGLARLRGELLDTRPYLLLAWDYAAASGAGSASDFMDSWGDIARLRVIDLDSLRAAHPPPARARGAVAPVPPPAVVEPERVVRCMLFADIVGFSKLREEELPGLWPFLAQVDAGLRDGSVTPPELVESWGDALYVVQASAGAMLRWAFALQRSFAGMDPARFGLSQPLQIRIGLHAGPVFQGIHPLTGRPIVYGSHVSRTARIEPVTLPGEIYASEQFVALLTAEEGERQYEADMGGSPYRRWYACDYLGVQPLAKGYGDQPVYHLRAREE